jgi:hypothetical protein
MATLAAIPAALPERRSSEKPATDCKDNAEPPWTWVIFAISAAMAAASVVIAAGTLKRAKRVALVDTFLSLRSAFAKVRAAFQADVFNDDIQLAALSADDRKAALKYWYNAFDEWYVTQRLFSDELGILWEQYYREAIKGTCRSEAMLCALAKAKKLSKVGVDEDFYRAVMKLNDEHWGGRQPDGLQALPTTETERDRVARWNSEYTERLNKWETTAAPR